MLSLGNYFYLSLLLITLQFEQKNGEMERKPCLRRLTVVVSCCARTANLVSRIAVHRVYILFSSLEKENNGLDKSMEKVVYETW